jgi:hypothetical protein
MGLRLGTPAGCATVQAARALREAIPASMYAMAASVVITGA